MLFRSRDGGRFPTDGLFALLLVAVLLFLVLFVILVLQYSGGSPCGEPDDKEKRSIDMGSVHPGAENKYHDFADEVDDYLAADKKADDKKADDKKATDDNTLYRMMSIIEKMADERKAVDASMKEWMKAAEESMMADGEWKEIANQWKNINAERKEIDDPERVAMERPRPAVSRKGSVGRWVDSVRDNRTPDTSIADA